MGSHFQAVPLVASPSYPNSIAWSKENLVAIASGHIITILNPTLLVGPRGLITLPPNKPFPIGVVKGEDLLKPCLMPTCLSHETRPCVRSISWSPPGFTPNSGCLLAVCTTEGRVKLYRSPFCEFCAEWVEVMDISDILFDYLRSTNFGELNAPSTTFRQGHVTADCIKESGFNIEFDNSVSGQVSKHRKRRASTIRIDHAEHSDSQEVELRYGANGDAFQQAIHFDGNGGLESSKSNDKINNTIADAVLYPCLAFKRGSSMEVTDVSSQDSMVIYQGSLPRSVGSQLAKERDREVLPLITAEQYASRNAVLSSLIVAWSPVLQLSGNCSLDCFSNNYAILAVGGKSGNISFWRFNEPQCYTIEHGSASVDAMLIGLLQAHNSWITAISWGICTSSCSESQLVLASGSSDGSVKVWLADVKVLIKSSWASGASFSLFKEVTAVTSIPISTISLVVPVQSLDKFVLAIGKGSGSLETWICHISNNKVESAGVYDAHDQVVTGLSWAFAGCCLYSCSQDNSLSSWVLHGNNLDGVPFPSKFPGLKNSTNLSQVSDQCFGLALSPGELMIAVVRSFDASVLNQMYQARFQKAVIEFFWIGGQPLAIPSNRHLDYDIKISSDLTNRDLVCWESNILWSLECCENVDKVLVPWDVIEALLAFKNCGPKFVENVLFKWISSWFPDFQSDDGIEKVLSHAQNILTNISTRKMQLLNIICRRLMLDDVKADLPNRVRQGLSGLSVDEEAKLGVWKKLLMNCERELQERLVAFTFRAVLSRVPYSPIGSAICTDWFPVGVAQMKRWVLINSELVQHQLKLLVSKIGELGSRIHSICEFVPEESCSFCSASVPFESPEVAWCEGSKRQDGSSERHKLRRCAVSLQLGSITRPMWFCVCCQRWATKLAPRAFFTMPKSPLDVEYENGNFALHEHLKPLCPFCGILLQRSLPEFLLSASPV